MSKQEIIIYLTELIDNDDQINDHTKMVLVEAIKKLNVAETKAQLIEIAKLIAALIGIFKH